MSEPNLTLVLAALLEREGGGVVVTAEDLERASGASDRVVVERSNEMDGWVVTLRDDD
jgi:ABC-type sugar transport system ATPase subunit